MNSHPTKNPHQHDQWMLRDDGEGRWYCAACGQWAPLFYVTFGVQYKHEPHPRSSIEGLGDGYVTIVAADEMKAREMVAEHFGHHWSFIYPEWDKDRVDEWQPLGQLAIITPDRKLSVDRQEES